MRIVSLVPSLSETLVDLNLRSDLVGCTLFCVEPKDLHRSAVTVGGTKDFSLEKIRELRPTHILANQEENPKELILPLLSEFPTLLTFPKSPFDVPAMLRDIGRFLGQDFEWAAKDLETTFTSLTPLKESKKFLYFIWREPYMFAGPDTYISRFLEAFGFENAYQGSERYPALSVEQIQELGADICLFSTEPYPFRKRDAERLRESWPACPAIAKIDGRLLSWYGTMTKEAFSLVQELALGKELSRL